MLGCWRVTQVLLLSWCDNLPSVEPYQLVEVFSGDGKLSQSWWACVLNSSCENTCMLLFGYMYATLFPGSNGDSMLHPSIYRTHPVQWTSQNLQASRFFASSRALSKRVCNWDVLQEASPKACAVLSDELGHEWLLPLGTMLCQLGHSCPWHQHAEYHKP